MRARALIACSLAVIAVMATPGIAATTLEKVVGGSEQQFFPFVNDTYLIWTQNSTAHPNRYNAYAQLLLGAGRFKINEAGTRGFTGGIDPETNTAIYQQVENGRSNLYTIDLVTKTRDKLPQPINSLRWEWAPRISNSYILFQRDAGGDSTMYLYDRAADSLTTLKTVDYDRGFMIAGAVGETYASWTICTRGCNAFVYEIATETTTKLPAPTGKSQYAPAVDELRGNVYFVRSGNNYCGQNVGIWRRPVDLTSSAEKLVDLPDNIDAGWTLALDEDTLNGRLDAWFEFFHCRTHQGDVYEAQGLDS